MRYFLVDYQTSDGEHEYIEHAVTKALTYPHAEKKAMKNKKVAHV